MSKKEGTKKIGIKWKMFSILLVFIIAVITVVWIFQVALLKVFFQHTKFSELNISADKMVMAADDEDKLESVVYDCAEEYFSSVVVFRVEKDVATPIIKAGNKLNTIMPFFSKEDMQRFYEKADTNGGEYITAVAYATLEESGQEVIKEVEKSIDAIFFVGKNKAISALDVRIIHSSTTEYFIVQTVELMPVGAIVKTLNSQFLWIGIILVLLALVLASVMSRLITRPIIKMNAAAQRLALGHYDADFGDEKGYREVSELSDALNFASRELARSDKLQKELISNVSHDLRTPLTMIKGYGEVMRDIPGENSPENVQVIIDETERLTELVNDMLDMSKLQAGTRCPDMQLFSLTQVVRDTMKRYEKLTMNQGYKIDFKADSDAYVYADSVMILQVVYNLINNAVNYTGEDKQVRVEQRVTDQKVRISVKDTGKGIAKDDLPLIWDRYYKVDKLHKRAAIGTGLGLSIVKEILELHDAEFGVSSTQNEGSTFWFELSLAE